MIDPLPATFITIPPEAPTRAVVVGFSGGLDSSVLLHLLATQPVMRARGLRAIHIHHGLHVEANRWALHCHAVCEALAVPLQTIRVDVIGDAGNGLEASARDARYAAFADALGPDDVLALAHHRDDQAETFLMRALRASGPDGLAAMRPWRRFGAAWLWRPLLDTPSARLLAHARAHVLHWIDDPSNLDTVHDRNFLRQRVLPLLRERWPHADAAFARAAALSADAHDLLAGDDRCALADSGTADPQVLSVDALRALPRARRARVLRCWIEALALPRLPAQGVARIESDLLTAAADSHARFAWHGAVVRRWRGLLQAGPHREPMSPKWRASWDGRRPLALPGGSQLHLEGADGFAAPLVVHARQGGERIALPGRGHSHALKNVLQDRGVPPWIREQLPLLCDADGAVQAAGDRVYSAAFDAWLRAQGARLHWAL